MTMTKHIYIVRYGETQDNLDGVFSRADTPLTDRGKEQARSIG